MVESAARRGIGGDRAAVRGLAAGANRARAGVPDAPGARRVRTGGGSAAILRYFFSYSPAGCLRNLGRRRSRALQRIFFFRRPAFRGSPVERVRARTI